MATERFIKTEANQVGEEPDDQTIWWLDTARPIAEKPGFIAVQTYVDKDPNTFVKCTNMRLLFTDPEEYYYVCPQCFFVYEGMQWAGSTRPASPNWHKVAVKKLEKHEQEKGWCEFCDPVFGNGGWTLDL